MRSADEVWIMSENPKRKIEETIKLLRRRDLIPKNLKLKVADWIEESQRRHGIVNGKRLKDISIIGNVEECVIIDDNPEYILPEQADRYVRVGWWGGENNDDKELSRIKDEILAKLPEE